MDPDHKSRPTESILYETVMDFIPQIVLHIEPIVHRARFRGMRINDNQVKVIMMLHHTGGVRPSFISHHLNIQKGSLTGVLRSLRKKALIDREAVDGDERSYKVFLTELGREFVAHHLAECERRMETLFGGMDDKSAGEVQAGLESLTRYLQTIGDQDARS